ncbi:putative glutathione-specific gamma-glutamylcyclotransferase 2 [Harpegnathos saltator]|uniref:glutathione-specific gamma-glutamylcyclotransferase n=1 Tax=Harpegnathos saltator TaxID=610380 RepID=E2BQG7_HARSA|nr:putative glutathione-specific gamma-glutamylcyclotransferase 2 [Harpegnathos saltator]EFN82025.1 Cation transport regulator-like protein 2 [Harpegnathos saltator]
MWVFGYGSLIWKADFPYEKKVVGRIKGYVRRFYQKSPDHRGVPNKPGRVVTLLASKNPENEVWGLAYKISSENIDNVVNHLDFREKGGYEKKTVLFYPCNPSKYIQSSSNADESNDPSKMNLLSMSLSTTTEEAPFYLTIYIGDEKNPNYAGTENIDTIARHILVSRGISGSNVEYLYKLASAMRMIAPGVQDEHLFALEKIVKQLEKERENESLELDHFPCNHKSVQ